MKIKKFIIQYHYSDCMDYLASSMYDSFDSALSQLVYNQNKHSDVLKNCVGVQIKAIEFEL